MKFRIKGQTEEFHLETDKELIVIGRSSECDFPVPLDDFSRKHCQITVKGNYSFIMDLGSKNGVTLDGEKLKPNQQYPLYKNSRVVLANKFEFIQPNNNTMKEIDLSLKDPIPRKK